MSYSVRNCARNLLQVSFLASPPVCSTSAAAMLGPHGTHVRQSPATLHKGMHMALCFCRFLGPCWTPISLRPWQVAPHPPPFSGSRQLSSPPNLFSCIPPSHGLPFPVVESLSSSPPCLGGTTLLYILHPFLYCASGN